MTNQKRKSIHRVRRTEENEKKNISEFNNDRKSKKKNYLLYDVLYESETLSKRYFLSANERVQKKPQQLIFNDESKTEKNPQSNKRMER